MMATRRMGREQALQALYAIDVGRARAGERRSTEIVGDGAEPSTVPSSRDLVLGTLDFTPTRPIA